MADSSTVRVRLEVLKDKATMFRECQRALGHDEPEQTFDKMLELLYAAISLTSRNNPQVNLYTRDPSRVPDLQVKCPECAHQFLPPARSDGAGFRETSVNLTS
jgi:hypothetical protein